MSDSVSSKSHNNDLQLRKGLSHMLSDDKNARGASYLVCLFAHDAAAFLESAIPF